MATPQIDVKWLAPVATALSLVACYGTLAAAALLAAAGIQFGISNTLWAGSVVLFALTAVAGLALGARRHGSLWPLAIGIAGAAAVAFTMIITYDRLIEVGGFLLLGLAAAADWRKCRSTRSLRSAPNAVSVSPAAFSDTKGTE